MSHTHTPSITLISPAQPDAKSFLAGLNEIMTGTPPACLLLESDDPALLTAVSDMLLPTPTALMVKSSAELSALQAPPDGQLYDFNKATLKETLAEAQKQRLMAGVGQLLGRHEAMLAAEWGADVLLFGRLDRQEEALAHPKTVQLATWWSTVAETPCIALLGTSFDSVEPFKGSQVESLGVRALIWDHPQGPKNAMNLLHEALA
jgi:thiamine-phosphate pyrophosphorylase